MKEKYKLLSKNLGFFALSGFIPKALSFFLVPLYTNILSTADYGISDLITTTVMFLIPIATLDIQDAAMRYALDKKYDNKEVFNVALQIFIIGTVVVAFGSFCVSLFNIPGLKNEYLFFLTLTFSRKLALAPSLYIVEELIASNK